MSNDFRTVEVTSHLICGMMLGLEIVKSDDGWNNLVLDFLILRIMISWD